ncbi:MAG TPA: hypothetical protein VKX46_20415 [Ktedonobacteraceae bacterium]|nr:hypothetical protein [Ktedonobacteraceae bacterium]
MARRLLLFYMLFAAILFGGCASSTQPSVVARPTPTSTPLSQATLPPSQVSPRSCIENVMNFYRAIDQKDLRKAYTYFASDATTPDGQKLTYDAFGKLVQESGTASGSFKYTLSGFVPDPPQVVMTIDTGKYVYHSHLRVRPNGGLCPITTFDRI